jgi:hypothetical protein
VTFALSEASPHSLPIVSRLMDEGPAARAGLKLQDKLLSVDLQSVRSWSLSKIQRYILDGEPGSTVQLEVERGIRGRRMTIEISRGSLVMEAPTPRTIMFPVSMLEGEPAAQARPSLLDRVRTDDAQAKVQELTLTCSRLKVKECCRCSQSRLVRAS